MWIIHLSIRNQLFENVFHWIGFIAMLINIIIPYDIFLLSENMDEILDEMPDLVALKRDEELFGIDLENGYQIGDYFLEKNH